MMILYLVVLGKISSIFGASTSNRNVRPDPVQTSDMEVLDLDDFNFGDAKENERTCDSKIMVNMEDGIMNIRQTPKGICSICCPITTDDIRFLFYTNNRPGGTMVSLKKLKSRRKLKLDLNADTIIYAHGFVELGGYGSGYILKEAYVSRPESYNVILLDWSNVASFPWYVEALQNVRIVAKVLTKFLETYIDRGELVLSRIHLIGFSLGAQIMGFVGNFLRKDLRIRRITGLDPAYPGFPQGTPQLSFRDAEYVDIIHTDGGNFGIPFSIGHADFYINNGTYYQPGCTFVSLLKENDPAAFVYCSHMRAWKFYAESVIKPYGFPSSSCQKWRNIECKPVKAYMGFAANKTYVGNFYLSSNSHFAKNRNKF